MKSLQQADLKWRNRKNIVTSHPPGIVLVWQNGCPACANFKPIFERFMANKPAYLLSLDDLENPSIFVDHFGIDGVPTLLSIEPNGIISKTISSRSFEMYIDKLPVDVLINAMRNI